MKRTLLLIRGRIRYFFRFCPECNSDAPKLYNCLICHGHGVDERLWWTRFKAHLMIAEENK